MTDSEPPTDVNPRADRAGGVTINDGTVNARDIIGGNVYEITQERAYDVAGLLPNPYLGLAAFTYADAAKYGGREKLVQETVLKLTVPAAPSTLYFVTGASGSGKSSFAQAGLLPALEQHYQGFEVKHAVMRPAGDPLAALGDALWRQLRIGNLDLSTLSPQTFVTHLRTKTPPTQINVLVIDQFEELLTPSAPPSRDIIFQLLVHLPPFAQTRTHIIATMRADYLPELFKHPAVYDIAKQGLDLRAMRAEELRVAIQQPLVASEFGKEHHFEPSLVDALAADAARDAAYLPLLQVTLEEIWRKGSLKRGAYSNLTDAIQNRANQVYAFVDFEKVNPEQPRREGEQKALLDVLVDLIDVSPDDDARRDVRVQRTKAELAKGDATRGNLIDQLAYARLLSVDREGQNQSQAHVDLIHESLLRNWELLRDEVSKRREELRQRALFEQYLDEWLDHERASEYLLPAGVRLEQARKLKRDGSVAFGKPAAVEFLDESVGKVESEQREELEREKKQSQRFRRVAIGAGVLFLVALVAAGFAFLKQQEAEQQSRVSESRALAAQSVSLKTEDLDISLLLGIEALRLDPNHQARSNLFGALHETKLQRTLRVHEGVSSVAYSPDGKLLASGNSDGTIQLWDMETGQPVGQPLTGHRLGVTSVAFHSDGKTLASLSYDGTIRLWDLVTGQQVGQLLADDLKPIHSMALSPDGKTLVSGSEDNSIHLWEIATGKRLGQLLTDHVSVASVAFSPDSKTLASGGGEGTIQLWDVATGKRLGQPLTGDASSIDSLSFSPDRKILASGSRFGIVRLWDVAKQEPLGQPLIGHTSSISSVVFSPSGEILVSGSIDGTIRLWDTSTTEQLGQPFTLHQGSVTSVALSPDGKTVASVFNDKTIRFWEMRTRQPYMGYERDVSSLAFGPTGKTVASASGIGTIRLWEVTTGRPLGQPLTSDTNQVGGGAFSPDGETFAFGRKDGTIQMWEVVTGKSVGRPLTGHTGLVRSVSFSPDGKILASASSDNTVRLWEAETGKPLREPLAGFTQIVNKVVFSPDGRTLVLVMDNGMIQLLEVATGRPLGNHSVDNARSALSVAFSLDGKLLAVGDSGGTIWLWEVTTGKRVGQPFTRHASDVLSLVFSPDGETLAAGTASGMVWLWDISTGKPLGQLRDRSAYPVRVVAFAPDGKMLASGGSDNTVRLWEASMEGWIELACEMVNRNLARVEYEKYVSSEPTAYDTLYAKSPTCPGLPVEPKVTPVPEN